MELEDILRHIEDDQIARKRKLCNKSITFKVSDDILNTLAAIKQERSVNTSVAIKEAINFYSQLLIAKNNKNNN